MNPIDISSLSSQLAVLQLNHKGDERIRLSDGVLTVGSLGHRAASSHVDESEKAAAALILKLVEQFTLTDEQVESLGISGLHKVAVRGQRLGTTEVKYRLVSSGVEVMTLRDSLLIINMAVKGTPDSDASFSSFAPTPPAQHLKPTRQPQLDPALANKPLPQLPSPPPVPLKPPKQMQPPEQPRTRSSSPPLPPQKPFSFNPQQHAANVGVASTASGETTPKGIYAKAVSSPFVESHAGHFPYGKVGGAPTTPLPTLEHLQKIDLNSTNFKQQFVLYKASLDAAMERAKVDGSLKSPKNNPNHFLPLKGVKCRFQDVPGVASTAVGSNLNANMITVAGVNLGIATQYPLESQATNHGNMLKEGRAPVLVVLNPNNEINDQTKLMPRYFENSQLFTVNNKVETKLIEGNDHSRISTTSGVWVSPAKTLPSTIVQSLGWQDQTGMGAQYLVRLTETITQEYALNILRYKNSTAIPDPQKALPVIHCRAGVGRTGTVFAAMAMAYLPKEISLTDIVMDLRKSRSHAMVQTPAQHEMLVHMAVAQGRPLI